ncbi:hypothetical protein [Nitrosomonas mobilis]|nr:hypothetical protein [Nitrosomonas mobilis]
MAESRAGHNRQRILSVALSSTLTLNVTSIASAESVSSCAFWHGRAE